MTRDPSTRDRLGGISAMLAQQDVCAQCGERHPDSLFGLRHAQGRGCPNVLMGAFPVLTPQPSAPGRAAGAVLRALTSERTFSPAPTPLSPGGSAPLGRKSGHSAIPWPMPMETDEFL